jgi:phage gp36-like protein
MPYLTVTELSSHLLDATIDAIQDTDNKHKQTAINAAIEETKGYLSHYDTAAIFATAGDARNPILLLYVKDIAVWHFLQLANPNVDLEVREKRYELSIKWLEKVQNGRTVPTLPLKTSTIEQVGKIKYGSNVKRSTHY